MALDTNADFHIAIKAVKVEKDDALGGAARLPTVATVNGSLTGSWAPAIAANTIASVPLSTIIIVVSNHSSGWMYISQDATREAYEDIAPGQSRDFELNISEALEVRQ